MLDDDPVREDEFGAHKAVAEAIARLVENEAGGKAIALEGTWGSGKSTVVELLKDNLEERNKGNVFVFDGWAHEGDSLRRALVEKFWAWIANQNLISLQQKEWKDLDGKVAGLARRRAEETVKTTGRLTRSGRVMVVLLALVPLGVALAARFPGWRCWLGLGLTASPFLLLLGVAVDIWRKGVAGESKGGEEGTEEEPSPWDSFNQVLGIFLRQVEKETKTQGWSTADPTSIEFCDTFRDVLQTAIAKMNSHKKLVMVLDNLDRIPRKEAMQAFADMRAFFEPERSQTNWERNFWLIVPFDPDALRGAAQGDELSDDGPEKAFREKFFQARFHVPQPVLVKWRDFTKARLKGAFRGHQDDAELEKVSQLYALVDRAKSLGHAADAGRYAFPTPREIKLFINRLGTVHLQWPCEKAASKQQGKEPVPFLLQAAFALCEHRVRAKGRQADLSQFVPGGVQEKDKFFREPELALLERAGAGNDWERHVAAMWYGVGQEEALHMLLRPQIWSAFGQGAVPWAGQEKEMPYQNVLRSRGIRGFWDIAGLVADEFISSGVQGRNVFAACAMAMAVLAKWGDGGERWSKAWDGASKNAIRALNGVERLGPSDSLDRIGENFAIALQVSEATPELAHAALAVFGRADVGAEQNRNAVWAKEAAAVMDAMVSRGWDREVLSFRVPHSPEAFIFLTGAAHEHQSLKQPAVNWVPSGGPDVIIGSLREAFEKGGFQAEYAFSFDRLVCVHPDWPWDGVADTVRKKLLEGQMHGSLRVPLARGLRKLVEQRKDRNEDWFGVLRNLKGTIQQMVQVKQGEQQNATSAEKEQIGEEIRDWEKIVAML